MSKAPAKGRRGPVSCAECRRLKVRCSKQVPCSSCVARGCQALCPNGVMQSAGKGGRYLNVPDMLERKIRDLTTRILELEQALTSSHAQHSQTTHPLLKNEHLGIITAEEDEDVIDEPLDMPERDVFKDLNSPNWIVAVSADRAEWDEMSSVHQLPAAVHRAATSFPVSCLTPIEGLRDQIVRFLPDHDVALRLVHNFYDVFGLICFITSRTFLIDRIITPLYQPPAERHKEVSNHEIGLLFIVMALACLLEAENRQLSHSQFALLAQAALTIDSIFGETTLTTIQTICGITHYFYFSGTARLRTEAYGLIGLATALSQGMGLHLEPSRFNMSAEETLARRQTFWELVTFDRLLSLWTGRPPSVSSLHFDCKMPFSDTNESEMENRFLRSKHTFAEECIVPVLDYVIISRNQPSYASCLRISKKLQEHSMPFEVLNNAEFDVQRGKAAQLHARSTMKATALLILHRDSCNRALVEAINDDFSHSRYAESVNVTLEVGCSLIRQHQTIQQQFSTIYNRIPLWQDKLFNASISLGALIVMVPGNAITQEALQHFEVAYRYMAGTLAQEPQAQLEALKELIQATLAQGSIPGDVEASLDDGDLPFPYLLKMLIKARRRYRESRQGEVLMEIISNGAPAPDHPQGRTSTTRPRRTATGSSQRTPPSRGSGASEPLVQIQAEDPGPIEAPVPRLLPSQHIERPRAHTPYQEVPSYAFPQLWPSSSSHPSNQRLPPLGDFVTQYEIGPGSSIHPHGPHHVQQLPPVGLEESYARYAWDDFMSSFSRQPRP